MAAMLSLSPHLSNPQTARNDQSPHNFLPYSQHIPPAKTTNRKPTPVSCFSNSNSNSNSSESSSKRDDIWEKKKEGFVDYDKGKHRVTTQLSGLGKDDIPKRYRLRVDGDPRQRDWKISEVVERILKLKHWEDIEGVLNRWAGRFARKNFPVLVRLFFKIVASGVEINFGTYSILLKNLLAAGKWRKYIEVLNWMEDSGIQPSLEMYRKVFSYACKDNSTEYTALIQEKIEKLKRKVV